MRQLLNVKKYIYFIALRNNGQHEAAFGVHLSFSCQAVVKFFRCFISLTLKIVRLRNNNNNFALDFVNHRFENFNFLKIVKIFILLCFSVFPQKA